MSSPAAGRRRRNVVGWLAGAAIGLAIIAVIAVIALRQLPDQAASVASPSPSATSSITQRPVPSSATPLSAPPSPAATANAPGVKPDSQHGLIVATGNMRTEDNERGLQQPSLFMLTPTSS